MMLITGMLIFGNISVGVRMIASGPRMRRSMARTTNVYGLRRASRTIHIIHSNASAHSEASREITLGIKHPVFHRCIYDHLLRYYAVGEALMGTEGRKTRIKGRPSRTHSSQPAVTSPKPDSSKPRHN